MRRQRHQNKSTAKLTTLEATVFVLLLTRCRQYVGMAQYWYVGTVLLVWTSHWGWGSFAGRRTHTHTPSAVPVTTLLRLDNQFWSRPVSKPYRWIIESNHETFIFRPLYVDTIQASFSVNLFPTLFLLRNNDGLTYSLPWYLFWGPHNTTSEAPASLVLYKSCCQQGYSPADMTFTSLHTRCGQYH